MPITDVYTCCEATGFVPSQWRSMRQQHLPKPGKGLREDGATDAETLRPVAILSVWWRLWGSARVRTTQVKAWTTTWLPAEAHGGKPACEVLDAVLPLLERTDDDEYLGSFDYSLAFDFTHPRMALDLFKHFGLPPGILGMLQGVWCDQVGYLQ